MNVVNAVTSGTTIGGYVSTSFSYNFNTAVQGVTAANPMGAGQANGFNLDVVNLTIEKPLDESEWAAGYKAEFLFGPDAKYVGTSSLANTAAANGDFSYDTGSDFAIKQAYVNLRAPVGNGLEFKMGVFDTIIGYEAYNFNANPNFTRSLGWAIEPTQHTGLLSSYRINDIVSAVTAPEDMGALAGSTLYGGVVYGRVGTGSITGNATPGATGGNTTSWYAGLTLATGVEGLSVGGAFDYLDYRNTANTSGAASGSTWVGGLYASYQATEKLSFHTRGEYQRLNTGYADLSNDDAPSNNWEATVTAQYDLWQNVISRLEFRWD
ncbi:MAG: porin, partial [Verrucomicrobia bacterium]|nr:porin [Verrucomicrobiota bacterium]